MNAIYYHRLDHGISRKWLAEQLGISTTTLWRYETGAMPTPRSILFHAAHLMHVPMEELNNNEI